jgi:hypothetical protein
MRGVTPWPGRARGRSGELDRRLAAGADPIESDDLALRVAQLGSPTARARLARALRAAVRLGDEYHASLGKMRLRRAEIRRNRGLLLALAERMDDGDPVGVRGLAMASQLLDDPRSPLFSERAHRPLSVAAFEALVELDRGLRIASTIPR